MPEALTRRIEARRLMRWFHGKFFEEVSGPLVEEKIDKRFIPAEYGGGAPNTTALRAARANIRYHLAYIGWLGGPKRLACRAADELRRSGGGGAPVGRRLSG